jgi:hypothetical protein
MRAFVVFLMTHSPLAAIFLAAALLLGCSEAAGPETDDNTSTVSDPAGDVFGSGAVQWDATALTLTRDLTGITVSLDFSTDIISPTSGNPEAMIGFVEFDVDQDAASGIESTVDEFRPNGGSTGMGADYALVLSDYASDSSVAVIDSLGTSIGRVKPVFDARRITIRIPLALLGGDDGKLDAAAIVGVLGRPSDIVPENGHLTSAGRDD